MKTLKYFSLVFLMLFSVRVMAQNEIKMHTGTVNIGEGKTYYFFDSGGEEEFTVAEDPNNDYRWKTWYNHNEVYTLTFKVPENSTKGIKVTFRSLLINNDHLIIYEGNPGDSLDMTKRIVDLTNNDYSTDYSTFTVMSHGNMNIRFRADGRWRDAGWEAEVKLDDFDPQAPIVMRKACDNQLVILPTCNGCSIYYNMSTGTPTDSTNASTSYTIGNTINALTTYPFTLKAIAYIDNVASGIGSQTITSEIAAPVFTNTANTDYKAYYTYNPTDKTNTITINTNRDPNINDTYYARYIMNKSATQTATDAASWPAYDKTDHPDGYQEMENPGGTIDYTNTTLTPDFYVHMLIRGTTCPDKFSAIQTVKVEHIYIPKPEIVFESTGDTIKCNFAGATICYTTDGTNPTANLSKQVQAHYYTEEGSNEQKIDYYYITIDHVTAGTTVKAMAIKTNYQNSEIASAIYSTGSGVVEGTSIVLIDDREDHNMSYYQKAADLPAGYPTEYLSSPDPRNVKITYKGGGVSGASAVAISALSGENQNEMIYLKTMEKTVIGMTGNYPYTVISNPFSKRPATGNGNNKTYYGFDGWKVISGGEYISEYSNGQTLPLDATIHFVNLDNNYTPNCLSAEIVFEATWTQATVVRQTSRPSFNGGTYETNFWVLSGNVDNNYGGIPDNCTMSARYPDGTSSTTDAVTRSIYPRGNNAKVEFVNINIGNNNYVNAEGYNFIVGRGVVNTGTARAIYGCRSDKTSAHTMKIESGTYSELRHFNAGISSNNTVNQLIILGCDYDRAKGDNSKLTISGNMYIGQSINLNRSTNNVAIPHVMSIIKSGNFNSNTTVNNNYTGDADESYYFSISNTYNTYRRALVVEGGHLRGIAGGIDDGDNQNATFPALDIRVRGNAQIDGVVYGAAEHAAAKGIRTMIFTGGTVGGWIAGGCNGSQTTGGKLNGNTYIYFGGNAQCNSNGSNNTIGYGQATGGNIFGAGSGNANSGANATVGEVNSSTIVIADEAVVERSVYGGGNYGYVATGSGNKSDIYVLGGTVKGSVYGGSNMQKGQIVNITMQNGTIEGSVYGGSNTRGDVAGPVAVNITGGEVKGNVHGGGYGEDTKVAGNVEVTIGGTNPQDTPTIAGDVYGGGALGLVNTNGTNDAVASKTTHVTVNNGTMNNVYGGGLGKQGSSPTTRWVNFSWTVDGRQNTNVTFEYIDKDGNKQNETKTSSDNQNYEVQVNTDITLTATGYYSNGFIGIGSTRYTSTITARYSDNNDTIAIASSRNNTKATDDGKVIANPDETPIAANVGTVTVDINGGNMINVFGCNNLNGAPQGSVNVNFNGGGAVNVYGGGNLADYLPNTTLFPTVNITGGKVTNNVYGGGAFAKVNKTIVNMTGGEAGSVYAGAQGDDKNKKLVNYNKTVNMQGGTAIMVYGGSFTCLDSAKSFVNISGGRVKTNVFGSGYFGDMKGDCYVYIGKNAITSAPHSGENGDKFTTTLSDEKPIWIESNVYAGANWGSFQGTFGEATITGASNIYIDGTGYNMDHGKTGNYMIIGGSVYGSGTSCAAGTTDHSIIVRKYGNMTYPSMTRSLKSIQRASYLILDESNIDFIGQGDISSMDPTVEYGIINIDTIYATNGNNMALSKPMDNVKKLGSYTCADVYATKPSSTNGYATPKNGIVINNGGYLMVRYDTTINNEPKKCYGALEGFFYMREPGDDAGINNEGYIFARPKYIQNEGSYYWSNTTPGPSLHNVNAGDGGFVAFTDNSEKNIFDANGNEAPQQQGYMRKGYTAPSVQMAYTNRTEEPQAENDVDPTTYRFWRYDPEADYPIVTREVVFVVKADEDAGSESTKFLTTTGSVQLPPSLGDDHKYYISGLTWGADGKDCNPANITKTGDETTAEWKYYDEGAFKVTNDSTKNADGTTNTSLEEYYSNPNSTFGFLMRFGGNFKSQDAMILDNNSFQNYFNERAHALAEVNAQNSTDLPELDFLVTYSDRLSQNEMWAEARMVIDEVDPTTGKIKQRIYLNISVTTVTKFGQDVETYVYASTAGTQVTSYTAQLNLPTFALADNTKFYATFTVDEASKSTGFGTVGNTTIQLVDYNTNNVSGSINLALQFNAESNEDKTNGWYHKGDAQNPNQPEYFDFNKVLANPAQINNGLVGASDGRKYTTIAFDLLYDPTKLKTVPEFGIGQKHVGDLNIKMVVDNIEGGVNTFNITIHVYVTGPTKFYYLDGVAGKDGNSGMFPDKAKKTLNGVLNASGYTVEDPIFVVNGVEPKSGATLTWNADKFLNSVTVPEEDKDKYTEEQLRQLSQVKVYRYPGGHPKEDGNTSSTNDFYNGMYTGQMVNVPAGTQFAMHNVCLSGGSDLDNNKDYNPNEETMEAACPLISIAEGATVSIANSSLINNNNTCTTAVTLDEENNMDIYYAGAISNYGTLTVDGIYISGNKSKGTVTGIYQASEMNLGRNQTITIADQIFLADKKFMKAPDGLLYENSSLEDVMVYLDPSITDLTHYSGRVIVRYTGAEPSAPDAPFWKTLSDSDLPQKQTSMLKSRKSGEGETYESDKYTLDNELTKAGVEFRLANGGSELVLPYIVDAMKTEYAPTANDIIMYRTDANLPVELLYFHATCMGDAVQFEWSTASETNNEYFTIERSSDAVNYEEVARIQGAGTTSQRSDYSFMADNNSNSITYYRLRQTDIDGKYEIFAPVALQCKGDKVATDISIYPVPARDQVNIFSSNSPMTRIEIYSIMGAKVAEESVEGNQAVLNISNLATGVYAVKVFTEDGQVSNVRLIKK